MIVMHEYHGAVEIIEHAEEEAKVLGHTKVTKINLVIGESSGYSFEAVKKYFDEVSPNTMCEGAEITVRTTKTMLRCPNCNELFVKKPLMYECPHCGTPGEPTDAGREMAIDSIESE